MSDALWRRGAVETAAAIRARKVSCVEIVEAHIARMQAANGPVNAITLDLSASARRAAEVADKALAAGAALGPLFGVPVTIKENVDQAGIANTNGVPANRDLIAPSDAPVVKNLLDAGAIVIARTNTPEFSLRWHTKNPLWGETRNPWDPTRTPGGSSGGGAAAVALGIGALAGGSDLGGSLRYPAYCCGIATIRPSLGRVPHHNASLTEERAPATQLMSVQGPLARTVGDVRLGLAAMSARSARDPWWVPAPLVGPMMPPPIRVALCIDPFGDGVDPMVADAVKVAGKHLADAGYAVEEVAPPLCAEAAEIFGCLSFTETRATFWETMVKNGSREILDTFGATAELFPMLDLAGYVRALADRTRILRAWSLFQETHPLVLMPVSARPAFRAGEDASGKAAAQAIFRANRFLVIVNLLGLPSAAVPTGIAGGLPMGVQIVGPRLREDLCLDAAEAIEQRAGTLYEALWARYPNVA
jgi:amidase